MSNVLLTSSGSITCIHGGTVMVSNPELLRLFSSPTPLVMSDLLSAPIVGCPVAVTPTTKPCTMVISVTTGQVSAWFSPLGQVALHEYSEGMTDGVPAASWRVVNPGQQYIHFEGV